MTEWGMIFKTIHMMLDKHNRMSQGRRRAYLVVLAVYTKCYSISCTINCFWQRFKKIYLRLMPMKEHLERLIWASLNNQANIQWFILVDKYARCCEITPSMPCRSAIIQAMSQSISYVWFTMHTECSVPSFFWSSREMYSVQSAFDHQWARNENSDTPTLWLLEC